MADPNYTSINPEENVCEELEESNNKTDSEEQFYPMDPIEIVGERPASNKSFKEELIKEETKFLQENNGRILVESGLGFCALQCRAFSAVKEQIKNGQIKQYEVKAGVNSEVDSIRTVRFKFLKDDSYYTIVINTENSQSSIALAKKNKKVDVIIGPVITNRAVFFLHEKYDSGIYFIIVYNKNKQWVEIEIDQNKVTDLEIGVEATANDCYQAIFRFLIPYPLTVMGYIVKVEKDSTLCLWSEKEKALIKKESNDQSFSGFFDFKLPQGNYSLQIQSFYRQKVTVYVNYQLDMMTNENGALWKNIHSVDEYVSYAHNAGRRICSTKWYLPAKWVNVLKNILFDKIFGKPDSEIKKIYDKYKPFISILIGFLGIIKKATIAMFALGTIYTLADAAMSPEDKYRVLMEQLISEKVGDGRTVDEINYEFKYGVVLEQSFQFTNQTSLLPNGQSVPKVDYYIEIKRWTSYPEMEGQEGAQGTFTINELGKLSDNYEDSSD